MSDAHDWAMTDLRRELLERADKDTPGALPEVLSAPTVRTLNHLVDHILYYDSSNPKLPDDYKQSYRYEWLMTKLESQLVWDAADQGHVTRMRGVAGRPSDRVDATGYERIVNTMIAAANMGLIKGPKGSGKTVKVSDTARNLYSEFDGELKILSNVPFKGMPLEELQKAERLGDEGEVHPWQTEENDLAGTLDNARFAEEWSSYLEFAKEPGEKLAIIDEGSTVMTGYSQLGGVDVVDQIGRAINALRKGTGGSTRVIIIGHENDADIHKMIRSQADMVMIADGKVKEGLIDKATLYKSWNNYKDDNKWFSVRGLEDIPETSPWATDTNYFAHLAFDLDAPDKQIQRGRLVDNWEMYQEGDGDESAIEKDIRRRAETLAEDIAQDILDKWVVDAYNVLDSQRKVAEVLPVTRNEVRGALKRVEESESGN